EMAYIKDAPYNIALANPTIMSQLVAPGFDGWVKKDVVALMLRMDKNLSFTQSLLGTEKPMFFSVQLFDKWVQNYDEDDNLLYSVGWGGKVKEHTVMGTAIFDLSYNNGRIRPNLVIGSDLSNGGGFAIPSVTFELSSKLRWKVEYDFFWDDGHYENTDTPLTDNTTLFGYLHNRDQLYTSLTYLF
ncbi:MAG TPA: LysR family transcriptional regulator, partial [Pseudomonas sp.]|nr:LysR family transcriptional regulator [Pseudomonas sp.]